MSGPEDQRRRQRRQRDRVVAKALRNRDETREKLLAQGRKFARRRAANVERDRDRTAEEGETTPPSGVPSTNPSVHSTMPSTDTNEEAAARRSHSTVPARPKGSTVPAADRLYGLRLHERIRNAEGHPEVGHPRGSDGDPGSDGASSPIETSSGEPPDTGPGTEPNGDPREKRGDGR